MTYKIEYDDEPSASAAPERHELATGGTDRRAEAAKIWEAQVQKTEKAEPIKKEEVSGTAPDEPPKTLPDRALVAKDLSEFIKSKKPVEDPVVQQAKRLEEALNQIQASPEPPPSFEDAVMQKLAVLEERETLREQREAEAQAKADYDAQMEQYRTKIVSNIKARETDYPALLALGREESVVEQLLAALDAGKDISEDDVASDIEKGLWTIYEKMASLSDKPSKEKPKLSTQPKQTQPTPSKSDDFDLHVAPGKKAAQAALWDRIVNGGGQT